MLRKGRPTERKPQPTLADECEAFLSGTLADFYLAGQLTPPVWAQLNRLAHGSFDDLRDLSALPRQESDRDGDGMWRFMLSRLARNVLSEAATADELQRLQIRVLWPLEDDLMSTNSRLVEKPAELYRLVTTALDENPSRRTSP